LRFPLGAQAYSKLTEFPILRQAHVSGAGDHEGVRSIKKGDFNMKHIALAMMIAVPAIFASGSAFAESDRCNVPASDWKPKAELQAQLEQKGWKVKRIKTEEGCYEVYGFDKEGAKQEAYFDPKTLSLVGGEDD
jgi:hypothetical protein